MGLESHKWDWPNKPSGRLELATQLCFCVLLCLGQQWHCHQVGQPFSFLNRAIVYGSASSVLVPHPGQSHLECDECPKLQRIDWEGSHSFPSGGNLCALASSGPRDNLVCVVPTLHAVAD